MDNPIDLATAKERFRKRVRSIRESNSFSREKLANKMAEMFPEGKSDDTIEAIEAGRRDPSLNTIFELAAALGVHPREFFASEDEGAPDPFSRFENVIKELPAEVVPAAEVEPVEQAIAPPRQRKSDIEMLQDALEGVRKLQELADEYGITDVFQDNGGKILQVLILLGLRKTDGREGNDAVDDAGNEYELKSLNVTLSTQVTTHHHLNLDILNKYRSVAAWYIAVYENIRLVEIWQLTPADLEEKFTEWEAKLRANGEQPLNNPKIPLGLVRKNGRLVYCPNDYTPPDANATPKRKGGPRKPRKQGGRTRKAVAGQGELHAG